MNISIIIYYISIINYTHIASIKVVHFKKKKKKKVNNTIGLNYSGSTNLVPKISILTPPFH